MAPVLLDAAYDTSWRDLKRNWGAVLSLALVAVGVTTAAVALVVHLLVPSIPWAAAIAIGAIVAPPDAVATTTVLQDVRLPHRVSVILRNEALLNDASTLLIYRLALAAVASGGSIGAEVIAPAFLLSLVGSVAAGLGLAWLVGNITRRIEDAPSSIIFQFVSTFGVWVVSERLGMSPILSVVAYGMTLARLPGAYQSASLRIRPSRSGIRRSSFSTSSPSSSSAWSSAPSSRPHPKANSGDGPPSAQPSFLPSSRYGSSGRSRPPFGAVGRSIATKVGTWTGCPGLAHRPRRRLGGHAGHRHRCDGAGPAWRLP